jgi:hypothetical protein
METGTRQALDSGDKVSVRIEVKWPAKGNRPDGFEVAYEITDGKTGVQKYYNESFVNP